jgi:hypothetical protein
VLIRLLLVISLLLNGWPMALPQTHASMHGDATVESGVTPPCHELPASDSPTIDTSGASTGLSTDCCGGTGCGCACMHAGAWIGLGLITVATHKPETASPDPRSIATAWHDAPALRPPIA